MFWAVPLELSPLILEPDLDSTWGHAQLSRELLAKCLIGHRIALECGLENVELFGRSPPPLLALRREVGRRGIDFGRFL